MQIANPYFSTNGLKFYNWLLLAHGSKLSYVIFTIVLEYIMEV